jgi:hypothetical protein
LRQRRHAFFSGESTQEFIERAVAALPPRDLDPWLLVFGSVYASPFFRTGLEARRRKDSVDGLYAEIRGSLTASGRLDRRTEKRLLGSRALAHAADQAFARQFLGALTSGVAALVADPTIALNALRRPSEHIAEILRMRAI